VCVCNKKKSERHLRDWLTSCVLGRTYPAICMSLDQLCGTVAYFACRNSAVSPQFLLTKRPHPSVYYGQMQLHNNAPTHVRGVTSSTISSYRQVIPNIAHHTLVNNTTTHPWGGFRNFVVRGHKGDPKNDQVASTASTFTVPPYNLTSTDHILSAQTI